jgi:DNA-binding response OmpR family regulator
MRPKHTILLVGADEEKFGWLRFAIRNWRYAVATAASCEEALRLLHHRRFELLLCILPFDHCEALVESAYKLNANMRTLILAQYLCREELALIKEKTLALTLFSNASVVTRKDFSNAELCERLRTMTAQKRGPKPFRRIPPTAVELLAQMQIARPA